MLEGESGAQCPPPSEGGVGGNLLYVSQSHVTLPSDSIVPPAARTKHTLERQASASMICGCCGMLAKQGKGEVWASRPQRQCAIRSMRTQWWVCGQAHAESVAQPQGNRKQQEERNCKEKQSLPQRKRAHVMCGHPFGSCACAGASHTHRGASHAEALL
jgi:hypothetical protein